MTVRCTYTRHFKDRSYPKLASRGENRGPGCVQRTEGARRCGGCQHSRSRRASLSHVTTGSAVPPHAAVATAVATATAGLAVISLSSVGFSASSTEKDQTWKAR